VKYIYKYRLILGVALVISLFLVVSSYRQRSVSTEDIKINFVNSHDVEIYDISEAIHGGKEELVAKVSENGQVVRLNKNRGYSITYRGNEGYEDGAITIDSSQGKEINIDPSYTRGKLDSLLESEWQPAHQAVIETYDNVDQYEIQKGKLYRHGEWYGTTMKYVGKDIFNADTLRIVLLKKDGKWVVKTDPPNITLSKFIHPDVPVEILRDVNNFL
jgi:hypothetical protein